jgi:hypothetical protein
MVAAGRRDLGSLNKYINRDAMRKVQLSTNSPRPRSAHTSSSMGTSTEDGDGTAGNNVRNWITRECKFSPKRRGALCSSVSGSTCIASGSNKPEGDTTSQRRAAL